MGANLILWKTKKQATVLLSTTEAKYKALSDACNEMIWIRQGSKGVLNPLYSQPSTIHEDIKVPST